MREGCSAAAENSYNLRSKQSDAHTAAPFVCNSSVQCCSCCTAAPFPSFCPQTNAQYACNVAGTCVAFLGSALLYDRYGISGSACFGAGLEAALLLGALTYLALCASKRRRAMPSQRAGSATAVAEATPRKHSSSTDSHATNGNAPKGHSTNNPFAAVASEQLQALPTECRHSRDALRALQTEAGIGADDVVLQLSRSLSHSLHSSLQLPDGVFSGNSLARLSTHGLVIPEDEPVCADGNAAGDNANGGLLVMEDKA